MQKKVEILSVGTELLSGMTRNSNAEFLCLVMEKEGLLVHGIVTMPDQKERIMRELKEAFLRSDILLVTGGLGPTVDDKTRGAIEETFPGLAKPIENTVGKASGLLVRSQGKLLVAMPGVPVEMKGMFMHTVQAVVREEIRNWPRKNTKAFYFCHLKETQIEQFLSEKIPYDEMEIGIYPSFGRASLVVRSEDEKLMGVLATAIRKEFSKNLYSTSDERIEKALHDIMIEKKKTLILAESCTGGAMAARLSAIPDASKYLQGSFVTYSNEMKQNILGVGAKTIDDHGAVSEEVVVEMARGALEKSGADFALADTGIAGPTGGTKAKPVGTIWVAIAEKGKGVTSMLLPNLSQKSRESFIEYTATYLFGLLWQRIS